MDRDTYAYQPTNTKGEPWGGAVPEEVPLLSQAIDLTAQVQSIVAEIGKLTDRLHGDTKLEDAGLTAGNSGGLPLLLDLLRVVRKDAEVALSRLNRIA